MYIQIKWYQLLLACFCWANVAFAQENQLINGGLEDWDNNGVPSGWRFAPNVANTKYRLNRQVEGIVEGASAASVDSMNVDSGNDQSFSNLMQTISAEPFRGKKVQFSAKVKVTKTSGDGRAQLWFRVDRPPVNGAPKMGAFDNMDDRPIVESEWKTYTIVAQIDEDAQSIIVGMLVFPQCVAWIDDVKLVVVSDDVPETGKTIAASPTATQSDQPQPFFNHWLWLALIALVLFFISYRPVTDEVDNLIAAKSGHANQTHSTWSDRVIRFAFRFSFVYWIGYSFPSLIVAFVPYLGAMFNAQYIKLVDTVVRWTGKNVLGIKQELVSSIGNGSGDTTFAYIQVLVTLVFALSIAIVWTVADRRKTNYPWFKDLLRSYLRYVLAITMLGYGLAKTTFITSQFSDPSVDQLMKTYGESSPMNILWTFMGASRAYTIFAGLGEVVGAMLLIWRRTAMLGALVVIGVMTNVVMLNFCYDVPVKLYSSHLLLMAFMILLPDMPRLLNVLLLNRRTEETDFRPPYVNEKTIWVQRAIKAWMILIAFAWPLYQHISDEIDDGVPDAPAYYGTYEVLEFTRDGTTIEIETDQTRWSRITFRRFAFQQSEEKPYMDFLSIRTEGSGALALRPEMSGDGLEMTIDQNDFVLEVVNDELVYLKGLVNNQLIEVRLKRIPRKNFLLVNRGFRWINEYPYNR